MGEERIESRFKTTKGMKSGGVWRREKRAKLDGV